jgi:hypothetical protein
MRLVWRTNSCVWFAPSPHELAETNACVPLGSYRQVHAGEGRGGGKNQASFRPLALTLSPIQLPSKSNDLMNVERVIWMGARGRKRNNATSKLTRRATMAFRQTNVFFVQKPHSSNAERRHFQQRRSMYQSAEEYGFQQIASMSRPKQDAANCGLGNGANIASSMSSTANVYFRLFLAANRMNRGASPRDFSQKAQLQAGALGFDNLASVTFNFSVPSFPSVHFLVI